MKAICHGQLYQKRMMMAYDKKIQLRKFQKGELVFKGIPQNRQDPCEKWSPNWEKPSATTKVSLVRGKARRLIRDRTCSSST